MNWATAFAIVGVAWALTIPFTLFVFDRLETNKFLRSQAEKGKGLE